LGARLSNLKARDDQRRSPPLGPQGLNQIKSAA
jgi:hypothetical protein